jgi:hypothetical protein
MVWFVLGVLTILVLVAGYKVAIKEACVDAGVFWTDDCRDRKAPQATIPSSDGFTLISGGLVDGAGKWQHLFGPLDFTVEHVSSTGTYAVAFIGNPKKDPFVLIGANPEPGNIVGGTCFALQPNRKGFRVQCQVQVNRAPAVQAVEAWASGFWFLAIEPSR